MKALFHTHKMVLAETAIECGVKTTDVYKRVFDAMSRGCVEKPTHYDGAIAAELNWLMHARPFYNVYPGVVRALRNTTLSIRPSQVVAPLNSVCVCFQKGAEPRLDVGIVTSFVFNIFPDGKCLGTDRVESGVWLMEMLIDFTSSDGRERWRLVRKTGDDQLDSLEFAEDRKDTEAIMRIAVGVSMLAKDERFCQPILLARDEGRTLDDDGRSRAVDRARRNGRYGFEIGKDIEVAPHFRRPHFGIRWCGPKKHEPRLVPISGCFVHKNEVLPVPTGYMGIDD